MRHYSYRAMLTSTHGCKRPVGFVSDKHMDFWEAGQEAVDQHLFSEPCYQCNSQHDRGDYALTDLERGEWSVAGGYYQFRDVYPARNDECQPQLELDYEHSYA